MDDLGFDIESALAWFPHQQETPYVLVRVDDAHSSAWSEALGVAVRRCYVSDSVIISRAAATGVAETDIIAAALPDPGATMSGDFGEILVYFYQAAQELPEQAVGPRKWRLKQDRTKAAPHSDVVHFVLPTWPTPSEEDRLLCAEVKTKATDTSFTPIANAIADSKKDRTSRLAKTLVWLRDRALLGDVEDVSIDQLNRFINATDEPQASRHFRADAIVCASLVDAELGNAPEAADDEYTVVVMSVPELKATYEAVFAAAKQATPSAGSHAGAGE